MHIVWGTVVERTPNEHEVKGSNHDFSYLMHLCCLKLGCVVAATDAAAAGERDSNPGLRRPTRCRSRFRPNEAGSRCGEMNLESKN